MTGSPEAVEPMGVPEVAGGGVADTGASPSRPLEIAFAVLALTL